MSKAPLLVPAPPFHDVVALQQAMQAIYDSAPDPPTQLDLWVKFYGFSSLEEWMAMPCSSRTGVVGTMKSEWFDLFPFVDLSTSKVEFDDLFVTPDGYKIGFFGRWTASCNGPCKLIDGTIIDLAGKSFQGLRYAYTIAFSPETKKAVRFDGVFDMAEWGRLMGSKEYSLAAANGLFY